MLKNKKHSKKFSRPIVIISILGVILGVSVMVVTLSVAVGFQNKIKGKLLSFGNHIQIESMFQSNNNETSPIITLNESFTNLYNSQDIYKIQKYAYKSSYRSSTIILFYPMAYQNHLHVAIPRSSLNFPFLLMRN